MKNLLSPLFLLLAGTGLLHAQKPASTFKITGQVTEGKTDSVFLRYSGNDGKSVHLAQAVNNGKFSFSGIIDGPQTASFSVKPGVTGKKDDSIQFYIEPGNMTVKLDAGQIRKSKLTGSQTQLDADALTAYLKPTVDAMDSLSKLPKTEDEEKKKEIKKLRNYHSDNMVKLTYRFAKEHPRSYVSEYMVYMYSGMLSTDSINAVYAKLPQALKDNFIGKQLGKKLAALEAGAPGKMASNFSTTDVNGKAISLNDFKGKYVLLDFWATWCVPCRASHPHLRNIYGKYKDKGLDVVGISDDDTRVALWKKAIETDSIGAWHHVLGGGDITKKMKGESNPNDIMEQYGISALPTKILIDPKGKIVARVVGDDGVTIDKKLEEIFK
ncbi:TlpA disulfide reductase family protein [Pedobacter sp. UBA5917]|jgi:thiol-disulfide isomerase/thioredoxin|uniref:TlpA disulfide reductase family protein n=1 Tax=Pedobacter sp. UBA5917 TaxID=1947061 RepID=UPI0025F2CA36|nr:TlpA disulfide reductase family protein [Pedobacter sp. UBA5917]